MVKILSFSCLISPILTSRVVSTSSSSLKESFTTTFFGKPSNEQVEQAAIFSTSIGDIASQITAQTTVVPDQYMNAWDNYQESFNALATQQDSQFNNPISSATPVGQSEPSTDPMAEWANENWENISP